MDFSLSDIAALKRAHTEANDPRLLGMTRLESVQKDFLKAVESGIVSTVDSELTRHDNEIELATLKEAVNVAAKNGDQLLLETLAKYLLSLKKPDDMYYERTAVEPFGLARFMDELGASHPESADKLRQAIRKVSGERHEVPSGATTLSLPPSAREQDIKRLPLRAVEAR